MRRPATLGETDPGSAADGPFLVWANGERSIAIGQGLRARAETPMTRLTLDGMRVLREQVWPDDSDLGSIVVLPGGEAGRLETWATDPGRRRWTWSLEFRGGDA